MTNTNIPDDELIQMAAFKLAEAARRMAVLAKQADAAGLGQLLMAASRAIQEHARQLREDSEKLGSAPPPAKAPHAALQAVGHTPRLVGARAPGVGGQRRRQVRRGSRVSGSLA